MCTSGHPEDFLVAVLILFWRHHSLTVFFSYWIFFDCFFFHNDIFWLYCNLTLYFSDCIFFDRTVFDCIIIWLQFASSALLFWQRFPLTRFYFSVLFLTAIFLVFYCWTVIFYDWIIPLFQCSLRAFFYDSSVLWLRLIALYFHCIYPLWQSCTLILLYFGYIIPCVLFIDCICLWLHYSLTALYIVYLMLLLY